MLSCYIAILYSCNSCYSCSKKSVGLRLSEVIEDGAYLASGEVLAVSVIACVFQLSLERRLRLIQRIKWQVAVRGSLSWK